MRYKILRFIKRKIAIFKQNGRLLVDCGAHLQMSNQDLGEILTYLARKGDTDKLRCYRVACANLNARNLTGNSALHAAAETGQLETVDFLLQSGAKTNLHNAYGQTPAAIASVLRRVK